MKSIRLLSICLLTIACISLTEASPQVMNLTVFQKKNKFGLVDNMTGKEIVSAKYDSIHVAHRGWFKVFKKDKVGLLTPEGKEYLKCKYEDIVTSVCRNDNYGRPMFFAKQKGLYNLMSNTQYIPGDEYLRIAISPAYEFYGELPGKPGYWKAIGTNTPFAATDNEMTIKDIDSGLKLFNKTLFDKQGNKIIGNIDNYRIINLPGSQGFYTGDVIIAFDYGHTIYKRLDTPNINNHYGMYQLQGTDRHFRIDREHICELKPSTLGRQIYIISDTKSNKMGIKANYVELPVIFTTLTERSGYCLSDNVFMLKLKAEDGWTENLDLQPFFSQLQSAAGKSVILIAIDGTSADIYGLKDEKIRVAGEKNIDVNLSDNLLVVSLDGKPLPYDRGGLSILSTFPKYKYNSSTGKFTIYNQDGYQGTAESNNEGIVEVTESPLSIPKDESEKPKYSSVEYIWASTNGEKSEQWIVVHDSDNVGLCDPNWRVIIPPRYKNITVFTTGAEDRPKGQYWWKVTDHAGKWGVIDYQGKTLVPIGAYKDYISMHNGVRVYNPGKMGMLDSHTLKLVIPCIYDPTTNGGSGMVYGSVGSGKNRRVALMYDNGGKYVVDIWTLGGKKIASKAFSRSAQYLIRKFITDHIGSY